MKAKLLASILIGIIIGFLIMCCASCTTTNKIVGTVESVHKDTAVVVNKQGRYAFQIYAKTALPVVGKKYTFICTYNKSKVNCNPAPLPKPNR